MAQYIVNGGTVTLRGVTFFIEADSEEEARVKAEAGDYEEYDTSTAETFDWEIDGEPELNE